MHLKDFKWGFCGEAEPQRLNVLINLYYIINNIYNINAAAAPERYINIPFTVHPVFSAAAFDISALI